MQPVWKFVSSIICISFLLPGCSPHSEQIDPLGIVQFTSENTIQIGIFLETEGADQQIAQEIKTAAQLAINHINTNSAIPYELIEINYGCNDLSLANSIRGSLIQPSLTGIIFSGCPALLPKAAKQISDAGVTGIMIHSGYPSKYQRQQPGIFYLQPSMEQSLQSIRSKITTQNTIHIVVYDSILPENTISSLCTTSELIWCDTTIIDFSQGSLDLQNIHFSVDDPILLIGSSSLYPSIQQLFTELGYHNIWYLNRTGDTSLPFERQIVFPLTMLPTENYPEAYSQIDNTTPVSVYNYVTYDAVILLWNAIDYALQDHPNNKWILSRSAIRSYLQTMPIYNGISGKYQCNTMGECSLFP